MRPIILTIWPEFIQVEGALLLNIVHEWPSIIISRPKVSSYHVLSISTQASTTFTFSPDIEESAVLKNWVKANRPYIDKVIRENLYDATHQPIEPPTEVQLGHIAHITNSSLMQGKPTWITAETRIANVHQNFYYLSCPNQSCKKGTGAYIGMEFTCHHCSMPAAKPQPRLRFDVQLSDGSGLLTASIEDKHAENILLLPPETLVTMNQTDQRRDISSINKRNHGVQFYFQIRNIASLAKEPHPVFPAQAHQVAKLWPPWNYKHLN